MKITIEVETYNGNVTRLERHSDDVWAHGNATPTRPQIGPFLDNVVEEIKQALDLGDELNPILADFIEKHSEPKKPEVETVAVPKETLESLRRNHDCSGPLSCLREHVEDFLIAVGELPPTKSPRRTETITVPKEAYKALLDAQSKAWKLVDRSAKNEMRRKAISAFQVAVERTRK